jgi:predicted TIM-barrel fold metal-dependent hydrolase
MAHRTRKSRVEPDVHSPIAFHPCSNGEYCPPPVSARDRKAEELFARIAEEKSRRLGITRRQFAESARGMAAALFVINQVYGCSDKDGGGSGAGSSADPGGDAGPGGGGGGTGAGADSRAGAGAGARAGAGAGSGSGASGRGGDGAGAAGRDGGAGFDVNDAMMDDEELACDALLDQSDFVLDIQTHPPSPLTEAWTNRALPMDAEEFITTLFVESETSVAVLSGIPSVRNLGLPNVQANALLKDILDMAGPRLYFHANVDPNNGPSELDYMESVLAEHTPAAWKVYPHVGSWRLDSQEIGLPFVEKARELGIPLIAAHRGIASDAGDYAAPSSPADLVEAARQYPDVVFLTYHSGWQNNVDENHAFDPGDQNPSGVDRLIKAVIDAGIGNDGNVYAELGSTWRNLMTMPDAAAHVLGKLLRYLGPDRIVWGTDSVFTGSPQEQIAALRAFQIPQSMQDDYGYPALTDDIKRRILGITATSVYGIDPAAMRCVIDADFIARNRQAYLHDRDSVPGRREKNYGPKTRREFLALRRFEEYFKLG